MSRCPHAAIRRAVVVLTAMVCATLLASLAPAITVVGSISHVLESRAFAYDASIARTTSFQGRRVAVMRVEPQSVVSRRLSTLRISLSRAAKEGTTVYRAVGPNELADLRNLGRYRVPPGGAEGKYFFETPEQASNFARMMGDKPYTTTSVRISRSQLGKGDRINPAREGPGYFFRTPDVPSGPVTIFDRSVLP